MIALIKILIILLIIVLVVMIFNFNTIFRKINNIDKYLYEINNKESKYFNDVITSIHDLNNNIKHITCKGHEKLDNINIHFNKLESTLKSMEDILDKVTLTNINNVDKRLDNIYKFINNLQLDINNKHNYICLNKLNKVILNTNTIKDCVELISNNADKLVKSLEAKNSLCKCKTNKSSSKKKKEEKQADNS